MNARFQNLQNWLCDYLQVKTIALTPLAGDASFRRYFRTSAGKLSYIVMDAPPDKESCSSFVAIAKTFQNLGLYTPTIYAADLDQGFLLLSDLGDKLYLDSLASTTADDLYQRAFQALFTIQSCSSIQNYQLPLFDTQLYAHEFNVLFVEWYLRKYLGAMLSDAEISQLSKALDHFIQIAEQQPQVCVHRDYHSRNLMVLENQQIGILDFQDAVQGPITYDLVSLLRDCYIDWPVERVENWVLNFHNQALQKGSLSIDNPQQFLRWFDWIGLQRHLKCLGIFSRKYIRDDHSGYLKDIPRTLNYAKFVSARYPELQDLHKILEKCR